MSQLVLLISSLFFFFGGGEGEVQQFYGGLKANYTFSVLKLSYRLFPRGNTMLSAFFPLLFLTNGTVKKQHKQRLLFAPSIDPFSFHYNHITFIHSLKKTNVASLLSPQSFDTSSNFIMPLSRKKNHAFFFFTVLPVFRTQSGTQFIVQDVIAWG